MVMFTSATGSGGRRATAGRSVGVFLVEDHEMVRQTLVALLQAQPDIEVVGEASSVAEALVLIPLVRPDVAVIDMRLPDGSGVRVCGELHGAMPGTAFLMLSSHADEVAVLEAFVAGAAGFLLKNLRDGRLMETIRWLSTSRTPQDLARHQEAQLHAVRLGSIRRPDVPEAGAALTSA